MAHVVDNIPTPPPTTYDIMGLTMEEYQAIRNGLVSIESSTKTYRSSTDTRTQGQIAIDLMDNSLPFKDKGWKQ